MGGHRIDPKCYEEESRALGHGQPKDGTHESFTSFAPFCFSHSRVFREDLGVASVYPVSPFCITLYGCITKCHRLTTFGKFPGQKSGS